LLCETTAKSEFFAVNNRQNSLLQTFRQIAYKYNDACVRQLPWGASRHLISVAGAPTQHIDWLGIETVSESPSTIIDKEGSEAESGIGVQTIPEVVRRDAPKRQPRFQVILWDDNDHSYDYVIRMMRELFGYPRATGLELARQVDTHGQVVCLTTTLEHAELKRDQIHAFGKDGLIARCQGSMYATIAPLEA
jgi:ATP-dependent Clp protease adaptor protein ClpS